MPPARRAEQQTPQSAIDGRTTRHAGYADQPTETQANRRNLWLDENGGRLRKLRHRGLQQVGWMFTFTAAAYNLVRIRNLSTAIAGGNA